MSDPDDEVEPGSDLELARWLAAMAANTAFWSKPQAPQIIEELWAHPPNLEYPNRSLPLGLLRDVTRKPTNGEVFMRLVYLFSEALDGEADNWQEAAKSVAYLTLGDYTAAQQRKYALFVNVIDEQRVKSAFEVPDAMFQIFNPESFDGQN
jgi:hypothetical protein